MATITIKFDKGSTTVASITMTKVEKEHVDSAITMLNYYTENAHEIFDDSKTSNKKKKSKKK